MLNLLVLNRLNWFVLVWGWLLRGWRHRLLGTSPTGL